MNQKERIAEILKMLEERQKVSQEELMEIFSISKDTARRDILKLVENDLAERYPGGVSRPILKVQIENYSNRLIKQAKEKQEIAEVAYQLVGTQMTVYLDVSTTVNFLASNLDQKNLFIVTNSMDNALAVSPKNSNQVYLLGGLFNPNSRVLSGEPVSHQLRQFNFDFAFIGGAGITEQGIFYSELTDVYLKEEIINNTQKVCLLIDSTKVNRRTAYKIDFTGIDLIITDQSFPKDLIEKLELQKIEVINVEGDWGK
ncbi:DeoR family transcriptional regulator, carbon catabolite repression regulator [Enterococcus sp. AZ135]|uniref:DeoR/GlpR family DNA-binding transcription regulator n=1 Tax=unclassified Enterococcus TaxID=2608891 RepID=UPI003F224558